MEAASATSIRTRKCLFPLEMGACILAPSTRTSTLHGNVQATRNPSGAIRVSPWEKVDPERAFPPGCALFLSARFVRASSP